MQEIRKPLLVDSLAAVAGGAASTSSATTYIESASGVGVGGRTGLGGRRLPERSSSRSCSSPRSSAWCRRRRRRPRLILVGFLMMTALTEAEEDAEGRQTGRKLAGIDFTDLGIGLAAALTIMFMPFTFSITDGIGIGFLAFVTVRAARGPGESGASVHVDRVSRIPPVLPRSVPAGHVRLDLRPA